MKKIIVFILLLFVAPCLMAGEDAGLAGAAYIRARTAMQPSGASMTGLLTIASGTTRGIAFDNDSDTKIISSAANQIGIIVGGATWLHADHADLTNVSLGENTLRAGHSGVRNTCTGYYTGGALTSGQYNTLTGAYAGSAINTGGYNDAHGESALANLTSGQFNCGYGRQSLASVNTTSSNTGLGYQSGNAVTGTGNSFFGASTGLGANGQVAAVNNSMGLGQNVYTTASDQAVIGDANVNDLYLVQGGRMDRRTRGQPLTFTVASTAWPLYVVGSNTALAIASGSIYEYEWLVQSASNTARTHYAAKITGVCSTFDNSIEILGSDTVQAWGLNHSLYGVYVATSTNGLTVIASGPIGSIWKAQLLGGRIFTN